MSGMWRSRWAAVGAAVAITLGAGGLGIAQADWTSGYGLVYTPINPCRLVDTRPAPNTVGDRTTPLRPEETYTVTVWSFTPVGNCHLPPGMGSLVLNVTAVAPTQATYLTLYPTGSPLPLTSNLNPTPGQPPTPNAVNVDLNASGQFDVFNKFGSVHVIIDVVGLFYEYHDVVEAKLPFAVSDFSTDFVDLPGTVATVVIMAPVDGQVTVNSSAYVVIDPPDAAACYINSGSTDTVREWFEPGEGSKNGNVSGTWTFDIKAGELSRYDYQCYSTNGTGFIQYPSGLTAIFTPAP